MDAFEQIWQHREEGVYRELFGDIGQQIYPLSAELFTNVFRQESVDPRWLFCGVLECPPHGSRQSWLYVSSGISNPWEDDPEDYSTNEFSGLGVEFVLETDIQVQWAIIILQRMIAYNILLAHGLLGDKPVLGVGHRIPLNNSIALSQPSEVRNLVIAQPDHYPASFTLASGRVDILHFIGITDAELNYAKQNSTHTLIQLLKEKGVFPLTTAGRASVV